MQIPFFAWLAGCGPDPDCERTLWYRDDDRDGFGRTDEVRSACVAPDGFGAKDGDCDDGNGDVSPGATERCNGLDDDCDGHTDGPSAEGAVAWYPDGDRDGFGDEIAGAIGCDLGGVSVTGDCDDTDPAVHPGAGERCSGGDEDCDDLTDDADPDLVGPTEVFYVDADADGYGAGPPVNACTAPAGHVATGGDCDDTLDTAFPGALEVPWNDHDDDCEGTADDAVLGFGTGLSWSGPTNPELTWFDDTDFRLFVGADTFEQDTPPMFEELTGVMLRFDADAVGGPLPAELDGRSWLRVFPVNPPQSLSPFLDFAPDATPGATACVAGAAGDTCDWLMIAGNDGVNGEINSAMVYEATSAYVAMPQARGLGSLPITVRGGDAASMQVGAQDVGFFVQCGPERVQGKRSDSVPAYVSDDPAALGGDTCFFHGDPASTAEPEVEVCDAGDCFVVQFVTDVLGNHFVRTADLPAEHWSWGDREGDRTLLVDTGNAAFVRVDGASRLDPVFAGESVVSFDLAVIGAGFVAAGLATDGRVLLEHQDGAGRTGTDVLSLVDPLHPSWDVSGVAVAVGPDRFAVAVTFLEPGTAWPRAGSVGWTFLGLP